MHARIGSIGIVVDLDGHVEHLTDTVSLGVGVAQRLCRVGEGIQRAVQRREVREEDEQRPDRHVAVNHKASAQEDDDAVPTAVDRPTNRLNQRLENVARLYATTVSAA